MEQNTEEIKMIQKTFPIIDFHTHTFPDAVAARAIAGMEEIMRVQSNLNIHAKTAGTKEALSDSTVRNGLDFSVVLPVATKAAQSEKINLFAKKTNEETQQSRLLSFGAIHPDCENYKEILKWLKENGIKGIKLHPDYQKTCFDDIRYLRILSFAEELDLITVTHAGFDPGYPQKIHCTPEMVLEAVRTVRPRRLVLAHMGGLNSWEKTTELLTGRDLYLDTANCFESALFPLEKEKFCAMVKAFGEDRILFATDSPWTDQGEYVKKIRSFELPKKTEEKILGGNAAQLLKL